MADGGGVGLSLNLNSLLSSLFGTGQQTTNTNGNTSSNSTTQTESNTDSETDTTANGTSSTKGSTTGATTGSSSNSGTSVGSSSSSGTNTSQSNTTGGNTSNQISTTVNTSDPAALASLRASADTAIKNASNPDVANDLLTSSLTKALTAFGTSGTIGIARGAGLYNSTTEGLLAGQAAAQASADAESSILSYRTTEQQIADSANAAIVAATGTSTTTGSSTGTNFSGTTGTGTTSNTGTTSGSTTGVGNSNTTSTGTNDSDTVTSNITKAIQNIVSAAQSNNTSASTSTQQQTQQTGGLLDSVVCTELKRQGRMDKSLWLSSMRHFNKYPTWGINGYYMWSKPLLKELKTNPESWFSRFICAIFTKRAKHVSGDKSLTGYSICGITYFLSWVFGKYILARGY